MALAVCGVAAGQLPPPSATDAVDQGLLVELKRRQLYDVGTDYARVRMKSHHDPEVQAFWTDQLVQVHLRQMWEESRVNRRALMQQSVELITEFLETQPVRAETALALRLTQIETLTTLARINLLLNTVGHRGPLLQTPEVASVGVLPLVDQAQELVDALLRQLQRNRGRLERRQAGVLRERGNQLALELDVIRWLAEAAGGTADPASTPAYRELLERVRALARAARSAESRHAAALMLADLQIAAGDADAITLLLNSRRVELNPVERLALQLRTLLREDKAMEALETSYAAKNVVSGAPGRLTVLRLEALLLLRMQADDLKDPALKTRSDSALTEETAAVFRWSSSAWKDAALQVLQRYELVKTVGAEVAALVEQVELLRASGNSDEAIRVLRRSLRLLPPDASAQAQAALRLRLGEILISQQKWDEARSLLQRSAALFADADQPAAAATAALLDVYCSGQQWRLAPADDALRDAYFNGLLEHRRRWTGETATEQSTEWLVQLTQQLDPLLAAEIMAERARAADVLPERLERLIQLGEQLELARDVDGPTRATKPWKALVDSLTATCEQDELLSGELTDAAARLLLLCSSLTTDARTELAAWGRLQARLPDAEAAVVDPDHPTRRRLRLLQLLAEVRSSTDTQRAARRRQQYTVEVREEPAFGARQLARYLSARGRIQPGDRAIAETLEQLTEVQLPAATTASELSALLTLATLANRVTREESIRQQLISRLLPLKLSPAQTTQIATALMTSEPQARGPAAGALRQLWQRIHDEAEDGSELWLESCVQLAEIHAATGDTKDLVDAARRLEVTAVIHPDWGTVERKRRVQEFLRRARSAAEGE